MLRRCQSKADSTLCSFLRIFVRYKIVQCTYYFPNNIYIFPINPSHLHIPSKWNRKPATRPNNPPSINPSSRYLLPLSVLQLQQGEHSGSGLLWPIQAPSTSPWGTWNRDVTPPACPGLPPVSYLARLSPLICAWNASKGKVLAGHPNQVSELPQIRCLLCSEHMQLQNTSDGAAQDPHYYIVCKPTHTKYLVKHLIAKPFV